MGITGQNANHPALRWRANKPKNFDLFVYSFRSWTVIALDARQPHPASSMTSESRRVWASSLHGEEGVDGFLRLWVDDPLRIAGLEDSPAMEMQMFSDAGVVDLQPTTCTPGSYKWTSVIPRGHASFCTQNGDMKVTVRGPESFADAVFASFTASAVSK